MLPEGAKPYKYVTNRNTRTTYLFVSDGTGSFRKEAVFLPQLFETMSERYAQHTRASQLGKCNATSSGTT